MSSSMTITRSPITTASQTPPIPSALTTLLSTPSASASASASASTQTPPTTALPLEILHNLRHQHSWTDLRLHLHHQGAFAPPPSSSSSSSSSLPTPTPLPKPKALKPSISDLDLTSPNAVAPPPPPQNPTSHPSPRSAPPSSSTFNPPNLASPKTTTTTTTTTLLLLSGHPPNPLYTHPDLQRKLLKAGIPQSSLAPEREWVLPTTVARTWTLRELCGIFDSLPARTLRVIPKEGKGGSCRGAGDCGAGEVVEEEGDIEEGNENGDRKRERKNSRGEVHGGDGTEETVQHQDAKRVLLAMKAHEGRGGDGTIVYYIVQEGEVKPRQN